MAFSILIIIAGAVTCKKNKRVDSIDVMVFIFFILLVTFLILI